MASATVTNKHTMTHTSKSYRIAVALSRDPLFQTLTENREIGGPLGDERVIEKFQFYQHGGDLFLIYENADRHNDWRTSLRRYRTKTDLIGSTTKD